MVKIWDIEDQGTLKAWLENQPREVAVWIASRAAARVLPVWWDAVLAEEWTRERDVGALLVLRCLLVSSVAPVRPSEDIRRAAEAAYPAAVDVAYPADAHATNAAYAAIAYAAAAAYVAASPSTSASAAAASAFAAADATDAAAGDTPAAAVWHAVRVDAKQAGGGNIPNVRSLWPEGRGPLLEQWEKTVWRVTTSEGAEDWRFWTYWYDALLDGRPMLGDAARTWEMLEEIALIDTATWDAGPEVVNPVIRKIWEGCLVEEAIAENPLALRITRNETTGKLESAPKEERDLEEIVDGIRQALREFIARCKGAKGTDLGNVILSAFDRPIKDLRRDIGKHRENPRQLFRVLEETRREMRLIARDEGFANDSTVDRLLGNLEQQGEDICVAAPEVLEEVKARLAVRVQLFTAEQSIAAMRMTGGMIVDSAGLLRSAAAQALLVIMDEGRTEADKRAAWTFILGALPRGARAMRADGEDGAKASDEPSLIDTVAGYADKASKIDKGIDALQEAAEEGGPWVSEVISQIASGNLWGLGGG